MTFGGDVPVACSSIRQTFWATMNAIGRIVKGGLIMSALLLMPELMSGKIPLAQSWSFLFEDSAAQEIIVV